MQEVMPVDEYMEYLSSHFIPKGFGIWDAEPHSLAYHANRAWQSILDDRKYLRDAAIRDERASRGESMSYQWSKFE